MSLAPSTDEIVAAVEEHGSWQGAAEAFGYTNFWLRRKMSLDPELDRRCREARERFSYHGREAKVRKTEQRETARIEWAENGCVITYPTSNPRLGDVGQLIRECGLDPDDWTVVSVTLNKWEGMTAPQWDGEAGEKRNKKMPLNQWKVTLKRAVHLVLAMPAVHVPPVKIKPRKQPKDLPELIVVEGDHQVPYHATSLHTASLYAIQEMHREHNMVGHVFLGDTMDLPTLSKYKDHPAAVATPNECIQGSYNLLREKREAAPCELAWKLKGNHDWRIEGEQLARAEREYGARPATEWESEEEEIPALDLRRLLHLEKLGIELVVDPRGWEHAEVELVPGMAGLVVRHGWLVGTKTAENSLAKRGRSIIVGHTHKREHVFKWDPSPEIERQAVVCGTMSAVRGGDDKDFPHFAPCDPWLQGFVTVTRWPDGDFAIEHVRWDGKTLRWRDKVWMA